MLRGFKPTRDDMNTFSDGLHHGPDSGGHAWTNRARRVLVDTAVVSDVPDAHNDTRAGVADDLSNFVECGLEEFADRVAPGLELPESYAGHAVLDDTRAAPLLYVVGLLIEAGEVEVSGINLSRVAISLLRAINPGKVEGFSSYRVAESVLVWEDCEQSRLTAETSPGGSLPRVLLADLSERPSLRRPNWTVVAARCLWALSRLNESRDPAALSMIIGKVRALFQSAPTAWINDGSGPWTQYDIYTPDMYLLAAVC